MHAFHSYEPRTGHELRHNPITAIADPRVIGWVSTVSASGRRNLAPYSFFNMFSYAPPLIGFASEGWKDSARNVEETKAFVWNLVSRDLSKVMSVTSAAVDPDVYDTARAKPVLRAGRTCDDFEITPANHFEMERPS